MLDFKNSIDILIEEKIKIMVDNDKIKVKPCQGCDTKILSQMIKKGIMDNKIND